MVRGGKELLTEQGRTDTLAMNVLFEGKENNIKLTFPYFLFFLYLMSWLRAKMFSM